MAITKKTRYIVVGERNAYDHDFNHFSYINEDARDIFEIWRSVRPFKLDQANDPIPAKFFTIRAEAVEFKNRANSEQISSYDKHLRTKFKVINETIFNTVYIKYDKNQRVSLEG